VDVTLSLNDFIDVFINGVLTKKVSTHYRVLLSYTVRSVFTLITVSSRPWKFNECNPGAGCKCQPYSCSFDGTEDWGKYRVTWESGDDAFVDSPYGKPGEVLWVREAFTIVGTDMVRDEGSGILLKETPQHVFKGEKQPHIEKLMKWKPSIHMPKSACRIFLEVVSVKVERLHSISESDAQAEGAGISKALIDCKKVEPCGHSYRAGFKNLWESINGGGSWQLNPWVWVVEFKRIDKPAMA